MNICKSCGNPIPRYIKINNVRHNLRFRRYCLDCVSFKSKDRTKIKHITNGGKCVVCGNQLFGKATKFCNVICKGKYQYMKNGERQTKEHKIENIKKIKIKKKILLRNIFGDKCFVCGYDKRLVCHRKDGMAHKLFCEIGYKKLLMYLNEHSGEYVHICAKCHKHVHWIMTYMNMNWDDIIEKIKNTPVSVS